MLFILCKYYNITGTYCTTGFSGLRRGLRRRGGRERRTRGRARAEAPATRVVDQPLFQGIYLAASPPSHPSPRPVPSSGGIVSQRLIDRRVLEVYIEFVSISDTERTRLLLIVDRNNVSIQRVICELSYVYRLMSITN